MKNYKVLVYPSGTQTAVEIIKSLQPHHLHIELFGADCEVYNAGFSLLKDENTFVLPHSTRYSDLEKIVGDHDIDFVYPAHPETVLYASHKANCGVEGFIVSGVKSVEICYDKLDLYNVLTKSKFKLPIRFPKIYPTSHMFLDGEFPLFIRLREGGGSKDAQRIDNADQLKGIIGTQPHLWLLSEYLSGKEYTVDCISDLEGKLLGCVARSRDRIKEGIATKGSTEENPLLEATAQSLALTLKLKGGWNFQAKEDKNGSPCLLEVNPRIGGASSLSRMAGLNTPYLTFLLYAGLGISTLSPIQNLYMTRYFTEDFIWKDKNKVDLVVCDLDDTLILYGSKRASVDKILLDKIKAMGVPVLIVTKNPDGKELASGFFSKADIIINEAEDKFTVAEKYIKDGSVLFIDDAFSELKMIQEKAKEKGRTVFTMFPEQAKEIL